MVIVMFAMAPSLADDGGAAAPAADAAAGKIVPRKPTRFIRLRRDEFDSPVALQTASVKYVLPGADGKNDLEVVLESVIHVGDRSYYREFNRRFRHYDAVLYELIAPPEKLIPDLADQQPHPLRMLQRVSAEGLGFASQIDEIDYKARNLVHSDLSPAELAAVTEGRGDDQVTMLLEMFTDILRKRNIEGGLEADEPEEADRTVAPDTVSPSDSPRSTEPTGSDPPEAKQPTQDSPPAADTPPPTEPVGDLEFPLPAESEETREPVLARTLRVLSDPDGAVKIRRILAKAFDSSPSLEGMLRPSQQATLIKARNDRALHVFQEQLDAGKRRIAFFWGAGHMADFERQLVLNYGVQPAGVVWRDAWDLRDGAVEFSPLEAILEKSLRGSLKDALQGFLREEGNRDEP